MFHHTKFIRKVPCHELKWVVKNVPSLNKYINNVINIKKININNGTKHDIYILNSNQKINSRTYY